MRIDSGAREKGALKLAETEDVRRALCNERPGGVQRRDVGGTEQRFLDRRLTECQLPSARYHLVGLVGLVGFLGSEGLIGSVG